MSGRLSPVALLTALTLALGVVAQLTSRPGAFDTAVWPPAGLNLALVLVGGRRGLAAVAGTQLVFHTAEYVIGGYSARVGWLAAAPGVAVATAIFTAQAALAGRLVRRWVGDPALLRGRDVFWFLAAAGPVQCLFGSVLAVGLTCAYGVRAWAEFPGLCAGVWWADVIGGVVFAPIGLALAGEPAAVWRPRRWTVGLPLLLATAAAAGGVLAARRADAADAADVLRAELAGVRGRLFATIDHMVKAGSGGRFALPETQDLLGTPAGRRAIWSHLATIREFVPELSNVLLVVRVADDDRAGFEAALAAGTRGGLLAVSDLGPGDRLVPAARRPVYMPVAADASAGESTRRLGFDLLADPVRGPLVERALASGRPALSDPVFFHLTVQPVRGLILACPLPPQMTPTGRPARPAVLVYLIDLDALTRFVGNSLPDGVTAGLSPAGGPGPAVGGAVRAVIPIGLADRDWVMEATAGADFLAAHRGRAEPVAKAVAFGLVSLLAALLLVLSGQTGLVAAEVDARTRELEAEVRARKVTAAWLEVSEARLAAAQRIAGLGYWEWDPAAAGGLWSDDLARVLGVSVSASDTGTDLLSWVHPDDRDTLVGLLPQDTDDSGAGHPTPVTAEVRVVRPDGEVRWLLLTRAAGGGLPDGLARGTAQDITARKTAELAVRESEERLRTALDAAGMGTWELEVDAGRVTLDAREAELFGFAPGGFDGTLAAVTARVHPDDRAGGEAGRQAAAEAGGAYTREFRVVTADGAERWLAGFARLLPAAAGRPARLVGVNFDVTARKAAEVAVREQGERLQAALDAARMGTWEWVVGTGRVACDARQQELFGFAPGEFDGRPAALFGRVHPADRGPLRAASRAAAAGGGAYRFRLRVTAPGRPVRWVDSHARLVPAAGGRPARVIGVDLDVTDQVAAADAVRLSEERLQALLRHSADVVTVLDPDGRRTFVSGAVEAQYGHRPADLRGASAFDHTHPDDRPLMRESMARALAEPGRPVRATFRYRVASGEYRVLDAIGVNLLDHPAVGGVLVTTRDVTDLRLQSDELARKTRLKRAIIDAFPGFIAAKDRDGRYLLMNAAQATQYGTTPQAAVGRTAGDLMGAAHGAASTDRDVWVMATNRPLAYEADGPRADGTPGRWHTIKVPLPAADGTAAGVVSVATDVTDLKRAEAALRERADLDALRAAVGLALNADAPLPELLAGCAEAVRRHTGAAFVRVWTLNHREQVLELQASVGLYTHTDGPHGRVPVGRFKIGRIAAAGRPHLTNRVVGDPEVGDQAWAAREGMVAFAGHPLVCGGRVVGVVALFARHELSAGVQAALGGVADALALGVERKRAEAAVRRSEAELAEAQRVARVGSWEHDLQTDELRCSAVARELYGFAPDQPLTGSGAFARVHPDDYDRVVAGYLATAGGGDSEAEFTYLRPDGAARRLVARGRVTVDPATARATAVGTVQDVTEQRQAEADRRRLAAAVQQTQRLDSLGTLAGGIAHDFNNLLTGVLGNASLARELVPADSDLHEFLRPIEEAAQRAAHLCQQMLAYAGRGGAAREVTDLGRLVADGGELIKLAAGRRLTVHLPGPADLPPAEVDPAQVRQAVLNLVQNAAEAAGPGGRVWVRVGHAAGPPPAEPAETWSAEPPAGPHVWVEVADDGPGMPAAVRERAFEPFYSTRAAGRGLGLSTAHGIARGHGGAVRLACPPGGGTAARLCLPLDPAPAAPLTAAEYALPTLS